MYMYIQPSLPLQYSLPTLLFGSNGQAQLYLVWNWLKLDTLWTLLFDTICLLNNNLKIEAMKIASQQSKKVTMNVSLTYIVICIFVNTNLLVM